MKNDNNTDEFGKKLRVCIDSAKTSNNPNWNHLKYLQTIETLELNDLIHNPDHNMRISMHAILTEQRISWKKQNVVLY